MHDREGIRAIGATVAALAGDPYPAGAFHRGAYHRLRVGRYRIVYEVDEDAIMAGRAGRVAE